MEFYPITPVDHPWLAQFWAQAWGSGCVVVHGQVFTPDKVEGITARESDHLLGVITFFVQGESCEIVTIDSLKQQRGVGSALLGAVARQARKKGCRRLFLVTTNDNLRALEFYQKRGFRLCALRAGAADQSRKVKPEIPFIGENDIPIHDELELEFDLRNFFDVELMDEDIR